MRIRLNSNALECDEMTYRRYAALFIIGVLVLLVIAAIETVPGYMDADYYYVMGLRIASNHGWSEPIIWNYLNDPQALPQPAFTYWMPFAAIFAGMGIKITQLWNFLGARLGFLLVAGCAVPLTAYLGYTFTNRSWAALMAGLLAIFSGFYYAYLPTTDTFGIYLVLGGVFFLLVSRLQKDFRNGLTLTDNKEIENNRQKHGIKNFVSPLWVYLFIGSAAGLMHLTRADGLLWFGLALIAIIVQGIFQRREKYPGRVGGKTLKQFGVPLLICFFGYLLAISPWIIRNVNHYGKLFVPGMSRAFWLTDYNELFAYPASQLTYENWLDSGLISILNARGWAFGMNLLNTLAVQGGIFLVPLIITGIWIHRKDWRVGLGLLAWLIIFIIMTLVFPFQGARGGFFHAGAALQPLFWALVPAGLQSFVKWGEQYRRWDGERALKVFSVGVICITILVTFVVTWQRVIGKSISDPKWGEVEISYQEVDRFLEKLPATAGSIIMANNPPGFNALTGRQAIVIPDGDLETSLAAGNHFAARYLVLDENHPEGLRDLYLNPGNRSGLKYLDSIGEMHIFLLEE
jgi:hypothetical protein